MRSGISRRCDPAYLLNKAEERPLRIPRYGPKWPVGRQQIGIAWYARPVVEHGLVYAASPGMRVLLYCFDLATGKCLWKTRRSWTTANLGRIHLAPSAYTTPGVAAIPVLTEDWIILNEFGAQGRDEGGRGLVYVDKGTGEIGRRIPAGQADYRMGYVPLAGAGDLLLYPDGAQRIQAAPPQITGQNRIVCKRIADGVTEWEFHVGPLFAEPVLAGGQAFIGTRDGAFFCLNLTGASGRDHFGFSDLRRVAWSFQAGGALNSAAGVTSERVFFGANDGAIYGLERTTGRLLWKTDLDPEPRAFRLFSPPAMAHARLYISSAARRLYSLDAETGALRWACDLPDWGRSRPVVFEDRLFVAAMDGTILCLRETAAGPQIIWRTQVGDHPVYADLVYADGFLLVSASDLHLYCLDAASGALVWRRRLLEHAQTGHRPTWIAVGFSFPAWTVT